MSKVKLARETACFEAEDNSQLKVPAATLIKGGLPRDPQGQSARLAHQFLNQNRGILRDFGVEGSVNYDGSAVDIRLRTGGQVGAQNLNVS